MLVKSEIAEIVSTYGGREGNTGSSEAQVAILTKRIEQLSSHLTNHAKDFSSQRGLMKLIGRRRSLLKFLAAQDVQRYQGLIQKLGLRK